MLRLLLITAGLVLLIGCRTTPSTPRPEPAQPKYQPLPPAPPEPAQPQSQSAPFVPPKVAINATYDKEIKGVIELANQDRWEEAQIASSALHAHDPGNPMLQRLHDWVVQQGQKRREQALEDKIREVEAKNSVFNPTPIDLLTEKKDRGLPATKDVRDTVNRIENTPYIPETYGKTIREKGPLFDIDIAKGPTAKVLEKEVSIHVDNVPLENIIVNLSQTAGVNIIADKSLPALKQTLIVNWEKVRLGEFFRYLGRNYDLQFQVGPDFVWVVDAKGKTNLVEETRFYKLRKGFVLPAQFDAEEAVRTTTAVPNQPVVTTETQKFKRFVADQAPIVPALEKAITNLFAGSKWMIDYERNLVVARGTPEQLEVLENIIRAFDQPIQQVLIEARFVTLSKPAFLQLGALWETGRTAPAQGAPQDFTGLINSQNFPSVNNVATLGTGLQEAFTNVFGRDTLRATITALEQTGESQTLSAPRLTVLNNRPASISDGKVQYYYEEYQVKQTVQQYYTFSSFVPSGKPTKITSGAELNVLASISGDGKHILLALNPRVNTDVQLVPFITVSDNQGTNSSNSFVISLPQYRTQELSTRVAVKSGETVAMGGVLARDKSTFVEAVPVLGSIPIIGALFRRRTEVDKPRYLLVFVTATILTDSGEFLIYDEPTAKK